LHGSQCYREFRPDLCGAHTHRIISLGHGIDCVRALLVAGRSPQDFCKEEPREKFVGDGRQAADLATSRNTLGK
jgi:hypothetical protein